MNQMITTNQKSIINTQKIKKDPKHNTEESHETTREQDK